MSGKMPEYRHGVADTHLPASAYHAPPGAKRDGPKSHTTVETIATEMSTASSQASIASSCTDTSEIEYDDGHRVLGGIGAQFANLADRYRVNGYEKTLDLASSSDLRATLKRPPRIPARAEYEHQSTFDSGKQRSWRYHGDHLASYPRVTETPAELKVPSSVSSEYYDAESQAAHSEEHRLPHHHSLNAPLYDVAPPDTTRLTAGDISTTSVEDSTGHQAVSVDAPADTKTPIADSAGQLHSRVQQSFREVQEAYDEYARCLGSEAEWDADESMEEEPEGVTELNEQECSPTPEASDSVGSGPSSGSSSRGTVTRAQRSRSTGKRHKRTQEDDGDSEDGNRHEKRRRPPPADLDGEQLGTFMICPCETCAGRDGGGISQWV
jgi:hypothetical protein